MSYLVRVCVEETRAVTVLAICGYPHLFFAHAPSNSLEDIREEVAMFNERFRATELRDCEGAKIP